METRTLIVIGLTAAICLVGSAAATLEIIPLEDFESSGDPGGPFTPPSKDYNLTNIGPNSLYWGAAKTADWLDLAPDWGLLEPSASAIVTVSLNADADLLGEGIYIDTLTFNDLTSGGQQTRGVTLTVGAPVAGALHITPLEDFEPSGEPGGPFTPPSKDYQLTNTGSASLFWGAAKTVDWLDLAPTWGELGPDESTAVTVSLNTLAATLGQGVYSDTVTFTDITNMEEQTRGVTLTVAPAEAGVQFVASGTWVPACAGTASSGGLR